MILCVLFSLFQVDGYAISSKGTKEKQNVQQQKNITGQVNDENGLPLPGVTILEKGSKNATLTDFDGKFTLKLENENSVLVFSFLGYVNSEIAVKGKTTINVKMQKTTTSLEEVVVVG
jgi:hypothetical protein